MKLIACPNCGDIFNLTLNEKVCSCGKCKGKYQDNKVVIEVSEESIILCFNNQSLISAIMNTKDNAEYGKNFMAWVLPKNNERRINETI